LPAICLVVMSLLLVRIDRGKDTIYQLFSYSVCSFSVGSYSVGSW
jgi:hypothetical protein